ncbi:hypothetical protein QQS21_005409 [Conoideocrella luteorostrata]|uniref:Cation efflux protein cytoplasmic domain-containing protein n=1 Tax=Conoideocrella luteorostrata TaxID=1105319 RepID=A0AAJ0CPU4_9HYPO|nr:hypothetical protein QQS21_005409 [Conoideocrella luteorostrata]
MTDDLTPPKSEDGREGPVAARLVPENATNADQTDRSISRHEKQQPSHADAARSTGEDANAAVSAKALAIDPEMLRQAKYCNTKIQIASQYPNANRRRMKTFYTKQNELIDQFLSVEEEEQRASDEETRMRPRIKFAVYASFTVNLCLFIIQLYAAISTGSLSLFATAADAFMDLVSSCVMLITSKLARRPSIYKYPVGRTRIEPVGIIVFCALMATVSVQLLIEAARNLASGQHESAPLQPVPLALVGVAIFSKTSLMIYCFFYRRFPSVEVFFIDHRNDIVVNVFGLVMSIVGDRFVWYLDPIGAICIALLILISWAANAFEQMWLLAGKGAPTAYVSKLIYVTLTHDARILKVDTVSLRTTQDSLRVHKAASDQIEQCRAYHAGQNYYVEVDIVMDADTPLRMSHDISQSLQRKLEGLADVERAFVHVDYEHEHNVYEEHKPLFEHVQIKSLKERLQSFIKQTIKLRSK